MRFNRALSSAACFIVVVGAFVAGPASPAHAVDSRLQTVSDAGPAGDFAWKGFNWKKRFWGGAPQYNKLYSAANVTNPSSTGRVTLKLTNPTGNAPVAAEFMSTRRGFGYGTYTTTVEKNVSLLQKEVVWGCLFTYDPEAAPGYNEIDLCEASAWGGGAAYGESWPVSAAHGYWFDSTKPPGQGNNTIVFNATTDPVLTHRMVWEPQKITFETFAGDGFAGKLLKRTVLQGSTVPVPAKEAVHFNLWVTGGGGGNPNKLKPESVTLRNFSFTPRPAAAVAPAPIPKTSVPTISGTARIGKTITANPGVWTSGTSLRYQWYRSGVAITGATARTYRISALDRLHTLTVRLTGSHPAHSSVTRVSAATARVT